MGTDFANMAAVIVGILAAVFLLAFLADRVLAVKKGEVIRHSPIYLIKTWNFFILSLFGFVLSLVIVKASGAFNSVDQFLNIHSLLTVSLFSMAGLLMVVSFFFAAALGVRLVVDLTDSFISKKHPELFHSSGVSQAAMPLNAGLADKAFGYALGSLIFGILSLMIPVIGAAAIYSAIQFRRLNKEAGGGLKGKKLAVTGVILGSITLILGISIHFMKRRYFPLTAERTVEMSNPTFVLPILQFTPQDGKQVLKGYKLTELEHKIFREMDAATASLPEMKNADEDLKRCYEVIIPIGSRYGLTDKQSIAFWTRASFELFEKE